MGATEHLVQNAARYAETFDKGHLPVPPALGVTVVACMDARMDLFALLGLQPGDAHIIRNAGGVITDDVIRSLAISQRLLGTTEIMLIHHTGCGMLRFRDDELKAQIAAETGLRPPFAFEAFDDVDEDVRQSIARIRHSPFVCDDNVQGFVYDVTTGRLNPVV